MLQGFLQQVDFCGFLQKCLQEFFQNFLFLFYIFLAILQVQSSGTCARNCFTNSWFLFSVSNRILNLTSLRNGFAFSFINFLKLQVFRHGKPLFKFLFRKEVEIEWFYFSFTYFFRNSFRNFFGVVLKIPLEISPSKFKNITGKNFPGGILLGVLSKYTNILSFFLSKISLGFLWKFL